MRFDDRGAKGKPQPQTAWLRRVESLEQLLDGRQREAWTRISHLDQHAIRLCLSGADQQVSVLFLEAAHRVDRIDDQVEYYLLQLDPIALDKRRVVGELSLDRDAVVGRFAMGKGHDFEDRVVDCDGVLSRRRPLDERTDTPDDLARATAIPYDKSERLAHLVNIWRLQAQPTLGGFGVGDRRRDRLVHFMGDRSRELPH